MLQERADISQKIRSACGFIPHEISHLINQAKIAKQLKDAPLGFMVRNGEITASGMIVTLSPGGSTILKNIKGVNEATTKPLIGVFDLRTKQIFLPNHLTNDEIIESFN